MAQFCHIWALQLLKYAKSNFILCYKLPLITSSASILADLSNKELLYILIIYINSRNRNKYRLQVTTVPYLSNCLFKQFQNDSIHGFSSKTDVYRLCVMIMHTDMIYTLVNISNKNPRKTANLYTSASFRI